jgi:hypothetical protein
MAAQLNAVTQKGGAGMYTACEMQLVVSIQDVRNTQKVPRLTASHRPLFAMQVAVLEA